MFTRVHESLHHTVADLTEAELTQEPHPPIGWLAWRVSRVMDSNVSGLSGREQLWIAEKKRFCFSEKEKALDGVNA